MTPADVSALVGVSRHVVRRWMDAGVLTTEDFGGKRMIPLSALKAKAAVWDSILLLLSIRATSVQSVARMSRARGGDTR